MQQDIISAVFNLNWRYFFVGGMVILDNTHHSCPLESGSAVHVLKGCLLGSWVGIPGFVLEMKKN